jgi:hypothetical protein
MTQLGGTTNLLQKRRVAQVTLRSTQKSSRGCLIQGRRVAHPVRVKKNPRGGCPIPASFAGVGGFVCESMNVCHQKTHPGKTSPSGAPTSRLFIVGRVAGRATRRGGRRHKGQCLRPPRSVCCDQWCGCLDSQALPGCLLEFLL